MRPSMTISPIEAGLVIPAELFAAAKIGNGNRLQARADNGRIIIEPVPVAGSEAVSGEGRVIQFGCVDDLRLPGEDE